jgi:hypothetical protein
VEAGTFNPMGAPVVDSVPEPEDRPSEQAKPEEFRRFEALAGKLVTVPKTELDETRKGEA